MKSKSEPAYYIYLCSGCGRSDVLSKPPTYCYYCNKTTDQVKFTRSMELPHPTNLYEAGSNWLMTVYQARAEQTLLTYRKVWRWYSTLVKDIPLSEATEDLIKPTFAAVKRYERSTAGLYVQAVCGFLQYLDAEGYRNINVTKMARLVHARSRKAKRTLPTIPFDAIAGGLEKLAQASPPPNDTNWPPTQLLWLRAKALVLLLADSGLRRSEVTGLKHGDIERVPIKDKGIVVGSIYKVRLIGKGDKEGFIRFGERTMLAIKAYIEYRNLVVLPRLENCRVPIKDQYVFWAHSKINGPNDPLRGKDVYVIVKGWGNEYAGENVHPHDLRHYFVTKGVKGGWNMKQAQLHARHNSIETTALYYDITNAELDEGYKKYVG